MAAGRILVTPRSLTAGPVPELAPLTEAGFELVFAPPGRQPTVEELKALLPGCIGYLAGVEPVPDSVLAAAPSLRVISRNGIGIDNIDLEAAARRGIAVRAAGAANARGVAELTLGLMFACLRWIGPTSEALRQGRWERRRGREIAGETVGLVGCGQIGRLVAGLMLGVGARVLASDPCPAPGFAPGQDFRFADFDDVLQEALVVSLHCPPSADRRPVIDAAALSRMREGAVLINTARSRLVDAEAVLAALQAGRLAAYATDVFDEEPPPPSPLLAHDRVVATPHIGGLTDESVARATAAAVANLLDVLAPPVPALTSSAGQGPV